VYTNRILGVYTSRILEVYTIRILEVYTNRIPGCPPMCVVPVSPRVIMFAFKLSFCRIHSLNCSRCAPEWTFKCEGKASLLGWHVRRWTSIIRISKDYVTSTWT